MPTPQVHKSTDLIVKTIPVYKAAVPTGYPRSPWVSRHTKNRATLCRETVSSDIIDREDAGNYMDMWRKIESWDHKRVEVALPQLIRLS